MPPVSLSSGASTDAKLPAPLTCIVRVIGSPGSILIGWAPTCRENRPTAPEKLSGLDVLILDGLRFKAHASHFNIAQAIEMAQQIGAKRTFLTHLTHDVDYAKHSEMLPPGIEFAYDGLKLELVTTTR